MRIQAVLWDLDGVLIDTGEFHYQSWADTCQSHGIPFSRELFRHTFGMNNWGTLTTILGSRPEQSFYDQITNQKETRFRAIVHGKANPLPGVIETLGFLKTQRVRQAVASSAPLENIDVLVDELSLRSYFDAIVSGSLMRGKPAPDVFLAAASAVGVQPENCLVIEDSIAGVTGAKSAGMLCLAVTTTNPADNLRQADFIPGSLLDLPSGFWEGLLNS
jgi:beta-phosphoglucomutase